MLGVRVIFHRSCFNLSHLRQSAELGEVASYHRPHGQKSVHCRYRFQLKLLQKFWPICLFSTNTFRLLPPLPDVVHEDCGGISASIVFAQKLLYEAEVCSLVLSTAAEPCLQILASASFEHEQLRCLRIQLMGRTVNKSSICETELVKNGGREHLKEESGRISLQKNTSDFK